jgi:hypothetical protein
VPNRDSGAGGNRPGVPAHPGPRGGGQFEMADRSAAVAVAVAVVSEAKESAYVTKPLNGPLWPGSCGGW